MQSDVDDSGPVVMPELPTSRVLDTVEAFKAIADPVRSRILGIIQHQPATAKQIAVRLGMSPGTIGHHVQVLEAAGLAQVVATRNVRGIVAKYYTRTARLYTMCFPPEVTGDAVLAAHDIFNTAREQFTESVAVHGPDAVVYDAFPHVRLRDDRVKHYQERLEALVADLLGEPSDPDGLVYGLYLSLFVAPEYMQPRSDDDTAAEPAEPAESAAENNAR